MLTCIHISLRVCVCASHSSQQQPRQGVQVSHVRVVAEDAVDPLLLVGEDVVQLSLQLRRLPRRALGRGRGRGGRGTAGRVPLGRAGVGPVRGGVGHQGGRGTGRGGRGPRGRVQGLDVNLLLGRRPEVRGSQRGRGEWSPPDRDKQRECYCQSLTHVKNDQIR